MYLFNNVNSQKKFPISWRKQIWQVLDKGPMVFTAVPILRFSVLEDPLYSHNNEIFIYF